MWCDVTLLCIFVIVLRRYCVTIRFSCTTELSQKAQQKCAKKKLCRDNSAVETETRHDFLVHCDLAFTEVKDKTAFWFHSRLYYYNWHDLKHTQLRNQCNRNAVVYVIEKALQCTCLSMNWCENCQIKEEDSINSRPLKIGSWGENSQLWYWKKKGLITSRSGFMASFWLVNLVGADVGQTQNTYVP